ncbi:MAG: DegV family protein [Solirubrobacteraceae bacterium]|nr:DegV family protein [Solirubrobacteraceae bacterium]
MPVAVVTDTTQYLPAGLLADRGVGQVSLYTTRDGASTRESAIADLDAFYASLRDASSLPSTSQPSVGDFLEAYEPLVAAGSDVVSIHLAGGISGTVESARQAATIAAGDTGRRVDVVDSRMACGALGLVVLAAAAAARAGGSVDDVVARAEAARDALLRRFIFAVDTLEFLRRGGRIGTAQAWVGGALRIKPILTLDGEITPIERVRTSKRSFERMVQVAEELRASGSDAWCVQHIQAPAEADRLATAARDVIGTDPLFVSEVGPVIGAHVGPGLLGIGGIPSSLLA